MTTLISASCKSSASTGGLHSCAESVHFASLSFLGLIGSFHLILLFGVARRSCHLADGAINLRSARMASIVTHNNNLKYFSKITTESQVFGVSQYIALI